MKAELRHRQRRNFQPHNPAIARPTTAVNTAQPKKRPRVAQALAIAAKPKTTTAVPTIQYRAAGEPMKGAAISKTATAAQATTLQCQTSRISVRSRSGSMRTWAKIRVSPSTNAMTPPRGPAFWRRTATGRASPVSPAKRAAAQARDGATSGRHPHVRAAVPRCPTSSSASAQPWPARTLPCRRPSANAARWPARPATRGRTCP